MDCVYEINLLHKQFKEKQDN